MGRVSLHTGFPALNRSPSSCLGAPPLSSVDSPPPVLLLATQARCCISHTSAASLRALFLFPFDLPLRTARLHESRGCREQRSIWSVSSSHTRIRSWRSSRRRVPWAENPRGMCQDADHPAVLVTHFSKERLPSTALPSLSVAVVFFFYLHASHVL